MLLVAHCIYNQCNSTELIFSLFHHEGFYLFIYFLNDMLSMSCRLSEKKECVEDVGGVADIVQNMEATERAVLGFMCKEIIDMGRLMWVKERGLESQLVKYVPPTISPENHLLIARHANHL